MMRRRTATAAPEAGADAPAGLMRGFAAFRHYNYRLYFGGQLISLIGTWMQNIGQGWLVLQLTHSAFYLGVVTALQSLPVLFFALLGGVVADRFPKNRLLVVTQSIMAILALMLALDVCSPAPICARSVTVSASSRAPSRAFEVASSSRR